jgi:uncharacterized phage-associated protein
MDAAEYCVKYSSKKEYVTPDLQRVMKLLFFARLEELLRGNDTPFLGKMEARDNGASFPTLVGAYEPIYRANKITVPLKGLSAVEEGSTTARAIERACDLGKNLSTRALSEIIHRGEAWQTARSTADREMTNEALLSCYKKQMGLIGIASLFSDEHGTTQAA